MSRGLLYVDDECALGAPADREAVARRNPVRPRTVVLDVDGDGAGRRVDDVLRRDADVRALGDDAGERVRLAGSEPQLLRAHTDLHLAAAAAQGVTRHLHLGAVLEADAV